jgi:hypothetical protein
MNFWQVFLLGLLVLLPGWIGGVHMPRNSRWTFRFEQPRRFWIIAATQVLAVAGFAWWMSRQF